jgi:hypothetical protein
MKVRGQGGADVERSKPGDLLLTIKVTSLSGQFSVLYVSSIGTSQVKLYFICGCCAVDLVSLGNNSIDIIGWKKTSFYECFVKEP